MWKFLIFLPIQQKWKNGKRRQTKNLRVRNRQVAVLTAKYRKLRLAAKKKEQESKNGKTKVDFK